MNGLVSIIMNCRNGGKYLRDSISSVKNQSYKNWELIFIDNFSTDNSKNIFQELKDSRMKYIHTPKPLNLGTARQEGLKNCKGEFIAFLDTDDLWMSNKIENQIKLFSDLDVGMVISNTIFFSTTKEKVLYRKKPATGYVFNNLLKNYYISLETLICRKSYMDDILFEFDSEFSMISDLDLALRLSLVSKLEYSNEILAKWRVHKDSDSWKKKNIFHLEKLNLIEKISKIKTLQFSKDFIKTKKKFIDKVNTEIIIWNIENGLPRNDIINFFYKKKNINVKSLFILFLIIFPFNKQLISIYRNFYNITP